MSGRKPSAEKVPLLEPTHVLQAISGRYTSNLPLVGWVRELGDMHAELIPVRATRTPQHRAGFCEQVRAGIDRVVHEIDSWAARNISRTKGAPKHTHSLGEVLSHIAKIYAETWWTVLHSADEEARHRAWFHLSEAREGYAELVKEIQARRLQLPLGWTGIRVCTE
ncbi:hypothetical protein [Nocardia lijiangensis]|uniref:hypothetical protein n=1 Tax=Nocardia lijiangensis TaxID=299618 RepID=UPI0012DD8D10|nr:hypothetical protein [Nocardia lijiangensis]